VFHGGQYIRNRTYSASEIGGDFSNGDDMSAGTWFWLIYVVAAVVALFFGYRAGNRTLGVFGVVVFVLLGLVGVAVFGWPVR
jgi:hypothetical protein